MSEILIRRLTEGQDDPLALEAAAVLIRRAGFTGLEVTDVTGPELVALAKAGEEIAKERAALLAFSLMNPAKAFEPFDGGASLRAATKQMALAMPEAP